MKKSLMKYFLLLAFVSGVVAAEARIPAPADSIRAVYERMVVRVEGSSPAVCDMRVVRTKEWSKLARVAGHPAFDSLLTPEKEREILSEVNRRRQEFGRDTMLTADAFYIMRPYYDFLHYVDPHYRVEMMVPIDGRVYKKMRHFYKLLRALPFDYLCINDTVLVENTLDTLFRKGDMVLSINGVTMPEYLKYAYADRYGSPQTLMRRRYYSHAVDRFDVKLLRGGRSVAVETPGWLNSDVNRGLGIDWVNDYAIRTFDEARCGYVAIKQFYFNNNRLIRIVRDAMLEFKAKGCTSVILDLRRNPGGNGHNFDRLLSVFIDKPTIEYCRGQRMMVSEELLPYYPFLTREQIGQVVDLPEGEVVREFASDPKLFVGGLKCYVLMSKDTGSIASSFCNILQYHDAAMLVGEPQLHNSLRYGETIDGRWFRSTLLRAVSVSTVEVDEYTKAVDGVLRPDIPIPYVAADYLTGRDAMLDQLLAIIRRG